MELIDTHAHLDDERFSGELDDVLARAAEEGVLGIISVGCWSAKDGFGRLTDILEKYGKKATEACGDAAGKEKQSTPAIYAALGVHPHDAKEVVDSTPFELISKLKAESERVVAVGETGLDYHYTNSPRAIQREVFVEEIRLAKRLGLPLIVHSRDADEETIEIMRGEGANECGGVIHCFSSSEKMAEEALKLGFYLSFTGIVTFKKADAVRKVVEATPTERILVETDSPYLAPVPYRAKRCEPAFVVETTRKIAEIKRLSLADVARITTRNAEDLFAIGEAAEEAKIAYPIRNSLYLNITNRCSNACSFCAKFKSYTVKGHYLKLKKEPNFYEVLKAVEELGRDVREYDEVVFCGFGEPLIRLDLVKKVGKYFKKMGCRIRVDTDGLANLFHRRNIVPELMFVDEISVSLNAPDSESYKDLCRTPFGDDAFAAILFFLKEAKRFIAKVQASVVGVPGLDVEACRKIAEDDIGVAFRVRDYNEVG